MTEPMIVANLSDEIVEKTMNLLIEGALCDGGHHKQWFLMEILRLWVGEEQLTEIFDEWYDPGIAP